MSSCTFNFTATLKLSIPKCPTTTTLLLPGGPTGTRAVVMVDDNAYVDVIQRGRVAFDIKRRRVR